MAELVNLNQFKKAKARSEKRLRADQNAVKFGQTLAQRKQQDVENRKNKSKLEAHKLDEPKT